MTTHSYTPKGVCSKRIIFDLNGEILENLRFEGGCDGNLKGLAKLAQGRTCAEVAALLSGLTCGHKKTSCPDQLARALKRCAAVKTRAKAAKPAA